MNTLEQEELLRRQGVPEEVIKQLLGLAAQDPTMLGKQYEQGAYLRRFATGDSAKTGMGALAQTIAGGMAGRQDKDYKDLVKAYQANSMGARDAWYRAKYPQPKSVTNVPQQLGGPAEEEELYD